MTDMKLVVLIWAVFQMLSFTASDTNSTTTESYTLIKSTNLAKPGCNSRCGDLIVPYPFGIGDNSECYINEVRLGTPQNTTTRNTEWQT